MSGYFYFQGIYFYFQGIYFYFQGIVIRTKEPVDPSVLEKIRACFKEGIEDEKDIRQVINSFVKDELFAGKNPPPGIFRKYNPTHKDIANEIAKVSPGIASLFLFAIKKKIENLSEK